MYLLIELLGFILGPSITAGLCYDLHDKAFNSLNCLGYYGVVGSLILFIVNLLFFLSPGHPDFLIVKNQSKHHIEVAMTTEQKVLRLHNYLDNNGIKKGIAVDAMCGLGALGIYLLKYGFEKVIFNDINPEMIETLKMNLEINDVDGGFVIYNEAFEYLDVCHADLCVIDAYPGADISEITQKAEKIADNVIII